MGDQAIRSDIERLVADLVAAAEGPKSRFDGDSLQAAVAAAGARLDALTSSQLQTIASIPARSVVEDLFHLVHTSCTSIDDPSANRRSATPSPSQSPSTSPLPFAASTMGGSGKSAGETHTGVDVPRSVGRVRAAGTILGSLNFHDSVHLLTSSCSSPAFPSAPGCTRLTHGYLRPLHSQADAGSGGVLSPSRRSVVGGWAIVHDLLGKFGDACVAAARQDVTTLDSDPRFTSHVSRSATEVAGILVVVYGLTFASVLR